MSCDARKWECLYCTYLNWHTTPKCTMCRSPKPLQVIEEGAPPPMPSLSSFCTSDNSIYTSAVPIKTRISNHTPPHRDNEIPVSDGEPIIINSPDETGGSSHMNQSHINTISSTNTSDLAQDFMTNKFEEDVRDKKPNSPSTGVVGVEIQSTNWRRNTWSCTKCSTLNWNISSFCKQCNTKSVANSSSNLFEAVDGERDMSRGTLKISELADPDNQREASPIKTPPRITNFPEGAEKFISSSNSPKNSNQNVGEKWPCRVCTYDNWPRSVKCVMCMCTRSIDQVLAVGSNEIKQSNNFSQSNLSLDKMMAPGLANMSITNNRESNFERSEYDVDENSVNASYTDAMRMRMFRNSEMDRRWLDACCGAVDGNIRPIEEFLSTGGDPTRQLTEAEAAFLDRPSAFDPGFTLIHLALRFHQENVLATLLSQVDGGPSVVKRVPSHAAPNIAIEIRRHVMASIRQRKGSFRCNFTSEVATFTLPSEIDDLPPETQETLFDEVLDRDVQKELEDGQIINWSVELNDQLNSRLYALWNRSAGDCLLDSVLQATWGIFDRDNGLRRALSDSLHDSATQFYQRWKESELLSDHARLLNFSLNEAQCTADWAKLLSLASQPGSSLEQLHIFALAHILRRPIIVYGVKYVKSFRGETLGFARYEGVYLPFLWEPGFCWRWPVALGYTRGHFSALIPMEPDCDPLARVDSAVQLDAEDINARSIYLPLTTVDGALLPIQFLNQSEIGKEEFILSQWLDVSFTNSGVMVARQRIQKRPLLVAQMVEEWLNHYRRFGPVSSTPYMRQSTATCYSSEGESDND